jgi:hypothetical protein
MGFDCIDCGEREIFAFESHLVPKLCWDCHVKRGLAKNKNMEEYYNRPRTNVCITLTNEKEAK